MSVPAFVSLAIEATPEAPLDMYGGNLEPKEECRKFYLYNCDNMRIHAYSHDFFYNVYGYPDTTEEETSDVRGSLLPLLLTLLN